MKLTDLIMGQKSATVSKADIPSQEEVPETVLSTYLRYYSTLEKPGYAVLVTGPWGVGKTYQVKKLIPESERYFVSLYGLNSPNDIHDAVLAACLPSFKAGEYVSTLSEVGKAMGDKFALAGFANSVWTAFLRQRLKADRTIIFDDLERSPLWANQRSELLGAINHYVEDRGFRVIVICHDERIADQLAELKEKTFGHTVQVSPQTTNAFDAFLEDLPNHAVRTLVIDKRSLVEEIWDQSSQSSLRILKHVINDIGRLSETFDQRHLSNQDAVNHVIRFFCALDIEVRAGNLTRDLLVERMKRYTREIMDRDKPDKVTPFADIIGRYPSSDLTGVILSDEIVTETLIEGRFIREHITQWLDQTQYFISASEAAPWLIVMKFDDLEDEILFEGIERMDRQFRDRSVTEVGEFLHIAALRLMLAEHNASHRTLEEETKLIFEYIDDLLSSGRLPPHPLEGDPFERLFNAYGGYGYWTTDNAKPYFLKIWRHVEEARQRALEDTYQSHAEKVLRQLKEDPSSIFQTISSTNYGPNGLAHVPILAQIPPKTFLDAWLSGPRSGWRQTTMALDNRYEHGQLDRNLAIELPWLIKIAQEMDARIEAAMGLDAYRLTRIKPKIFDTVQSRDWSE